MASSAPVSLPSPPPTISRGRGGVAGVRPRGASGISRIPVGARSVVTASETGAIIEMMQWKDAPPFLAPLATISGVVIDKKTKQPLVNTPVRFFRTPFTATTDSTGAFALVDVLPGTYEFDAGDPKLEVYDAAPELVGPIAIKYGPNELKVEIDGPSAAAQRGCNEKEGRVTMPPPFVGENAIFGTIVADHRTLASQEFMVDVLPAGAVAGSSAFSVKGKTDRAGRLRICGLPNGKATVFTLKGELEARDSLVVDPLHQVQLITLTLKRPPG